MFSFVLAYASLFAWAPPKIKIELESLACLVLATSDRRWWEGGMKMQQVAIQVPRHVWCSAFTNYANQYPIGSMYGIFTYIYHKNQPNVGIYIYIPYMDPMGMWRSAAKNLQTSTPPNKNLWDAVLRYSENLALDPPNFGS